MLRRDRGSGARSRSGAIAAAPVALGSASLADYLLAVAPALSAALVPEPALARVMAAARRLPPCTVAAFERPLGGAAPAVDLAVYVPRLEQASRVLAAAGAAAGPPGRLLAAARDGGLSGAADRFWLEFDTGSGDGSAPNVFFSPTPDLPLGQTVAAVLEALGGERLDAALRRALDDYAAAVSPARVFQVGAMLARPGAGLRVCTSRLAPSALRRTLAAFGWEGDPERVMAAYLPVRQGFPVVSVAVDLGPDGIGRRVGLELPRWVAGERAQRAAWTPALEHLEAAGCCTAEERRALLAWIGRSVAGEGPWPPGLQGIDVVMNWAQPCFERGLHHVKLVVDHDRFAGAKAYFGLVQSWAPRSDR